MTENALVNAFKWHCGSYTLSYKQHFFSTQRQCWLPFSWMELQMLLRCCLIYYIYVLYLCPCLDLGLFMSYLCFLVFILIFIFIMIHEYRYTCPFAYFLEYILLFCEQKIILTVKECEQSSDSKSSASGCCLAFAWFFVNFSLALLIKVLLIKKACTWIGFENTM